jgi:hypothetical protein
MRSPPGQYYAWFIVREPVRSERQLTDQNDKAGSGLEPETSQVSDSARQAAVGGYGVAVRRTGKAVEITLTANDEYAGIQLYDSLVQSISNGRLRLELSFSRS